MEANKCHQEVGLGEIISHPVVKHYLLCAFEKNVRLHLCQTDKFVQERFLKKKTVVFFFASTTGSTTVASCASREFKAQLFDPVKSACRPLNIQSETEKLSNRGWGGDSINKMSVD